MGSRLFTALAASGLTLAFVGGIALAKIPSADGTITGCYDKRTGALRIVDADRGRKCKRSELRVTWNQRGPAGAQGAAGAAGAPGQQGAPGPQGLPGATGPQGPQGETGPRGETGPQGATGSRGETGPQGATGARGETGPQGPQGATGQPGPQGPPGAVGPQGLPGLVGPQGPAGPAGSPGLPFVGGSAIFVDAAETTGYIGIADGAGVGATHAEVATSVAVAGRLSGLRATVGTFPAGTGTLTLTVMKNGAEAAELSCATTSAAPLCTDLVGTVLLAVGDTVSVRIVRTGGTSLLRNVRWSAAFATP